MMPMIRLQPRLPQREHELTRDFIATMLHAVDPQRATRSHMGAMTPNTPTHILAFGKAAIAMTHGAIEHLGDSFARATVLAPEALALDAQFKSKLITTHPCDHPFPTRRNLIASRDLVEHARSIPDDHRVVVLISGGSSAMLCLPHERATLEDIRDTTQAMLCKGAGIHEINAARARLDVLKNGGLAAKLMHVADRHCFVLSDVIGNDPRVIGSGPMHDANPHRTPHTIIASNDTLIDAGAAWCAHRGILGSPRPRAMTRQAADAGRSLANELMNGEGPKTIAVIMGGEPTVDASKTDGIGGPMLELGLSAALKLAQTDTDWTVISITSDGIDGPSLAAGLVLTASMLSASIKQQAAHAAIRSHDTRSICDTLGATIYTGPTGTNVNDIAIAIRWARETHG
jgi:glycerate 2-kinase